MELDLRKKMTSIMLISQKELTSLPLISLKVPFSLVHKLMEAHFGNAEFKAIVSFSEA
jgi:hypothetical protein